MMNKKLSRRSRSHNPLAPRAGPCGQHREFYVSGELVPDLTRRLDGGVPRAEAAVEGGDAWLKKND
jgi:hypothetical protein